MNRLAALLGVLLHAFGAVLAPGLHRHEHGAGGEFAAHVCRHDARSVAHRCASQGEPHAERSTCSSANEDPSGASTDAHSELRFAVLGHAHDCALCELFASPFQAPPTIGKLSLRRVDLKLREFVAAKPYLAVERPTGPPRGPPRRTL